MWRSVILLTGFLNMFCTAYASNASVAEDAALSPEQIAIYSNDALHGDAKAARKLATYYSFFENDLAEGNFWLQLAAELHDCSATQQYLGVVRHTKYLSTQKRIQYWVERVESECNSGKRNGATKPNG